MKSLTEDDITQLIREGNTEELQQLLREALGEGLRSPNLGDPALAQVSASLALEAESLALEAQALHDALTTIEAIDKVQAEAQDAVSLASTRTALQ